MLLRVFIMSSVVLCAVLFGVECQTETYRQGRILYENFCASCHMEDGTGLQGVIPPVANSDWLRDNPLLVPCAIRQGMQGPIVVNGITYNNVMPAERRLSHYEITNIINYMNHAWGNDYGIVKFDEVQEVLRDCPLYVTPEGEGIID